jgi:hypothetical protein
MEGTACTAAAVTLTHSKTLSAPLGYQQAFAATTGSAWHLQMGVLGTAPLSDW